MKTKTRHLSSRTPAAPPASRRLRPLGLALSCVLLTACAAVGPDYREPPPVDIGSGWTLPLASESQSADLARWWSALDDPILDRLMGTALAQNLDLRQAAARIDEAPHPRARPDRTIAASFSAKSCASMNTRSRYTSTMARACLEVPACDWSTVTPGCAFTKASFSAAKSSRATS